jgi:hypothetical protein
MVQLVKQRMNWKVSQSFRPFTSPFLLACPTTFLNTQCIRIPSMFKLNESLLCSLLRVYVLGGRDQILKN